jgi:hypothetical protein
VEPEVVVIVTALVLLTLAVLWHVLESYRGKQVAAKRRVVVNMADDCAMTGVLWRRHKRLVVLRGAELIEPGREPVSMDGEVVIERERIWFTQIVGGE